MKILFEYPIPFALAQDERTFQIVQLRDALIELGVEVEFLRWYDDRQTGDLLHYFGRATPDLIHLARTKGMKIVMAESLAHQAAFSPVKQWLERVTFRILRGVLKNRGQTIFTWNSYRMADAFIAESPAEAGLMTGLFDASKDKVHVIANSDSKQAAREVKSLYETLLKRS